MVMGLFTDHAFFRRKDAVVDKGFSAKEDFFSCRCEFQEGIFSPSASNKPCARRASITERQCPFPSFFPIP